jgi:dTDP-4-dehydrorhamnose 3,5-epimerase
VNGNIFDVVVDLRVGSPTFGHWAGFHLQFDNELLFIPHGLAHGFYAMQDSTVIYYMDEVYKPKLERNILWNDTLLSIKWPLISQERPIMSKKDLEAPTFTEAEKFDPPIGCMLNALPMIS